jgi:hypothetical protein
VIYSYLKYLWHTGDKVAAFNTMQRFAKHLSSELGIDFLTDVEQAPTTKSKDLVTLLAKSYCNLGNWEVNMENGWKIVSTLTNVNVVYLCFSFPR